MSHKAAQRAAKRIVFPNTRYRIADIITAEYAKLVEAARAVLEDRKRHDDTFQCVIELQAALEEVGE